MRELHFDTMSEKVRGVRKLIQSAGNQIGSVWFRKRSDGSKRKMSYRIHVCKPTYASTPKNSNSIKHKEINKQHNLITVFDCNAVRYNRKDKMSGRGEWKSIPLDTVARVAINGEIYKIIS